MSSPSEGRASGIVTLLTDFGLTDPYVGVMKGVLWRAAPGLRAVVDLTHAVPPQDVARAAFFLERSYAWFPPGTVHLAVVDPGVGTERAILVLESRGQVLIAPDNGLLGAVLASDPGARCRAADARRLGLEGGSTTFHGRDRFAPLAARIVEGLAPEATGPVAEPSPASFALAPVRREGECLLAGVLFADHFGNLITCARREDLPWDAFEARIGGLRARRVRTYAEGRDGELVCLLNSYGVVELAIRGASAAERLGAAAGTDVELRAEEAG